jgi:hypothetical protein
VGGRKRGIGHDRLFEEVAGAYERLLVRLPQEVAALQVRLVRRGVGLAQLGGVGPVRRHQPRPDDAGDLARQLPLIRQRGLRFVAVGLRPQMGVRARIDQLHRHANGASLAHHRAFDDRPDVELARDLAHGPAGAAVAQDRCLRDHPE